MTEASYLRLALLLQFVCFLAIFMAPSRALLDELQNQTLLAELKNENAITIGQNVQNLVDTLTADPDIRYGKSMMITCYIAVDHGDHDPEHFHEYPLSSNIGDFRDIRCVFRYPGSVPDEDGPYFQVENKWPLYWDQWEPPGHSFPYPYKILPFSWRKAISYMSAERANRLLKAQGHRGPYALVSLGNTTAHPYGGWCFLNVQIPDPEGGGQRTFMVDVRTGRVEATPYCNSDAFPELENVEILRRSLQ